VFHFLSFREGVRAISDFAEANGMTQASFNNEVSIGPKLRNENVPLVA